MRIFFITILITFGAVLFVWRSDSVHTAISKGILYASAPLYKARYSVEEVGRASAAVFRSKRALIEETEKLRQEVAFLKTQKIAIDALTRENQELKELFGRETTRKEMLLARVLLAPNYTPYDTLLIDSGEKEFVSVGDLVFAYENIAVGKVDAVYPHTSRVKLFSSPGEELSVLIGEETIHAIARGAGGGNFKVTLPRNIDVKEGDLVTVPAITLQAVGIVERIEARSSDSFQKIFFKSPINIFELKWVGVSRAVFP